MKTTIRITLLALLIVSFFSCKKDEETPPQNKSNIVFVTHDINAVTQWDKDSVYVIKTYDFYVNNTLSIQPGTVIKFHPGDGPDLTLGGSGTIVAVGTSAAPIIFTSYKDDDHGGDTNGDGTATTPARKDWGEINTNGLNGSKFEYCHFYYGGNSTYSATLTVYDGTVTVKNCVFAHNNGDDATGWYGALDMSDALAGSIVQNNVFYDNVRPLSINTAFNIDDSNIFHNPDNQSETNTYNGIFAYTGNEVTTALSWLETEVPFIIDDNDWYIESGAVLRLAQNVILKFKTGSYLILSNGPGNLLNYNAAGVFFTSYKDDNHGGDTNGDGTMTTPSNGDWGGIWNDSAGDYMHWTNILYN
ncbi:MAG: hypothetical protein GXO83_01100 [Chlorobi bacterium]|nr:hypothetical protein [Chlorobiota bacterium]